MPFTAQWRVYFENAVVVNNSARVTTYPAGEEPYVFNTVEKLKIPTGINLPPTGKFFHELVHFIAWVKTIF